MKNALVKIRVKRTVIVFTIAIASASFAVHTVALRDILNSELYGIFRDIFIIAITWLCASYYLLQSLKGVHVIRLKITGILLLAVGTIHLLLITLGTN